MSSLVGAAQPQFILITNDKRVCDERFFGNDELYFPNIIANFWCNEDADWGVPEFTSPWWPRGGAMLAGDLGADVSMLSSARWWGDPWLLSGCNGRFSFVGITRNQNGAPVDGVTVRCFRTSSNELVASVVSDANGYYLATTPYADAHYLTAHKASSPPIAGATIDTLTPG